MMKDVLKKMNLGLDCVVTPFLSEEDKQFALTYYYEKLIAEKGIDYQEYLRTMDLFLFKEYSEWIYCAHLANDFEMEYYRIYELKAREIARKLDRV